MWMRRAWRRTRLRRLNHNLGRLRLDNRRSLIIIAIIIFHHD
jgi:hypothetical protein